MDEFHYTPFDIEPASFEEEFSKTLSWLQEHPDEFLIRGTDRIYGLLSDNKLLMVTALEGENFTNYSTDDINRLIERRMDALRASKSKK